MIWSSSFILSGLPEHRVVPHWYTEFYSESNNCYVEMHKVVATDRRLLIN